MGTPLYDFAAGATNAPKDPTGFICVSKSLQAKTAADLQGKKLAMVSLRSASKLAVDAWLAKNNGDPKSLQLVEINFPDMAPSLERGTIDAAVISEPYVSAALRSRDIRLLADPYLAISPDPYLISVWFSTLSYVRANKETVHRFASAISEASHWANGHHEQSALILAKYAGMEPDTVKQMLRCQFADALHKSEIQPTLDHGLKFGLFPRAMSASELMVT